MRGHFLSSGMLFIQAKKAYQRTKDAPSEDAAEQNEALVSILFSAAALEAWMAEFTLAARTMLQMLGTSPQLRALAGAFEALQDTQVPIKVKFHLAKGILTGKRFEEGDQPFQGFALLFKLRNKLVHMKPEGIPESEADERRGTEKLVAELSSRAACVPPKPRVRSPWISRIATRSVARWACNVAAHMTHSIYEDVKQHVREPKAAEMLLHPFKQIT